VPVSSWERTVTYLRDGLFVVHDYTKVSPSADPLIRWAVARKPTRVADTSPGVTRYDVGAGDRYAGTMSVLLCYQHTFGKQWRCNAADASARRWRPCGDTRPSPARATACCYVLSAELGLEPGPALQTLQAHALAQAPVVAQPEPVRAGGGRACDTGVARPMQAVPIAHRSSTGCPTSGDCAGAGTTSSAAGAKWS
jgi:hypothetical protein